MIRQQLLYLFSSKAIVFHWPKISMDAWHVLASSDHKVSISVIITDILLKTIRYSKTLKPALVIIVCVSVTVDFCLFFEDIFSAFFDRGS